MNANRFADLTGFDNYAIYDGADVIYTFHALTDDDAREFMLANYTDAQCDAGIYCEFIG